MKQMMSMMPKMNKEMILMGNYVFAVVGIVMVIVGLVIYLFTRKKRERKIVKYTGLGFMVFGFLSLLNNVIQYLIFR
ncbi:LPXTG cell wall anchor domain-containing protein [Lysinibacillus sp. NPDC097231]|uniref:LPXTG cell wall anchor domain-containing protein n=1 Tax=Lysinibacillus sp. NPDC097231 TaxID=3364142 RepID=UPI00381C9587